MGFLDDVRRASRSVIRTAGTTVTYTQADSTQHSLEAVLGSSNWNLETDSGMQATVRSRDFLFLASDMDFEPAIGDYITWDGNYYYILADGGEPLWRYADQSKSAIRVHTKDKDALL